MKLISIDCETEEFSKDITPKNAQILGLAVGYDKDLAVYEKDPSRWQALMQADKAIYHYATFDIMKLKQQKIVLPESFEDTKIASHLLNENTSNHLKDLARDILHKDVVKYADVDKSDEAAFNQYACNDARWTYELWEKFESQLNKEGLEKVYALEKALVKVVHHMENSGMLIDQVKLQEFKLKVKEEQELRKLRLFELAGGEFEYTSPKQAGEFLYGKLGLKCPKKTPTGRLSTDRESLINLHHPISDALLACREVDKIDNAFASKYGDYIENDGRIRCEYNPLGTVTGRFSVRNPNQQQVSSKSKLGKVFRDCFIAAPGKKLVIADNSQMELRMLAHYSQDPIMLEAYQKNIDLHTLTAQSIFNTQSPTTEQRNISKIINFGIVYGLSSHGLYARLPGFGIEGFTEQNCSDFIDRYFDKHKKIRAFLNQVKILVTHRGWVKTLYGRRRRLKAESNREIRQAGNFIIQGSSADLHKQALVNIHKDLPKDCAIIGVIHDEIIVEAPEELSLGVKELLDTYMRQTPKGFTVPMMVECKIVDCWGQAK